jgi:hypothetical protein
MKKEKNAQEAELKTVKAQLEKLAHLQKAAPTTIAAAAVLFKKSTVVAPKQDLRKEAHKEEKQAVKTPVYADEELLQTRGATASTAAAVTPRKEVQKKRETLGSRHINQLQVVDGGVISSPARLHR